MNLTSSIQFPTDLIAEGRNFYSEFIFMDYSVNQQFTSTPILRPVDSKYGSVWLPVPRKINDIQTMSWGEFSGTSVAGAALTQMIYGNRQLQNGGTFRGSGGQIGVPVGIATGMSINPLLFMQFNSPNFKDHSLSWTLAPSSEAESNALKSIIDKFRYYSLGKANGLSGGLLLEYPSILFVKLYPEDEFTLKFRPCAVINVSVDFTGSGTPSFFKNGAPTVINLTLHLREIQLWDKTNYDGGKGLGADEIADSWKDLANNVSSGISSFRDNIRTKLGTK